MAYKMKTITVLGSTGSVGRTTIKLLLENRDKFEIVSATRTKLRGDFFLSILVI